MIEKQFQLEKSLSLHTLLHNNPRKLMSFTSWLYDMLIKMLLFARTNRVAKSTILQAIKYMKVHVGKQLLKDGAFASMRDILLIRTDAYVSTRLAMKMCDLRSQMFQPIPLGVKRALGSSRSQKEQENESKSDFKGTMALCTSSNNEQKYDDDIVKHVDIKIFGPCSGQVITDLISRQISIDKFTTAVPNPSINGGDTKILEK